ncbi:hypothetical protein RDWZM_008461 [Blomia tropicalis]|uniref:Uncharacterized protein n=1 Tax=Blomia tropicalis TaxID=40697 RepID=A0A9Q0M1G5_BLOTA|nr:hypothetical protein RDWZM_008461 [Blomia tropicalis]
MLTCFGPKQDSDLNLINCPSDCECYKAPKDGIFGNDAESFICNSSNVITETPDILEKMLLTLCFFEWRIISKLNWLETLYIENGYFVRLDNSFNLIGSKRLHTIVIKSIEQFWYIDREAFNGFQVSLQKLIITNTKIHGWSWLTSLDPPLEQLIHLDLSSNQLKTIPIDLHQSIPNVRVLYLKHNHFHHFSLQSFKPWLNIMEFIPASPIIEDDGTISRNNIFYTKEMKELYDYMYVGPDYLLKNWQQLAEEETFDLYPDHIYLNSTGKFQMKNRDWILFGQNFPVNWFDSVTSESQSAIRNQMMHIFSTNGHNTIRTYLFGKRMINFFAGNENVPTSDIRVIIDLVEFFLEEAAQHQMQVVFIMWNYLEFDFVSNNMEIKLEQQYQTNMIVKQYLDDTKLIGISIPSDCESCLTFALKNECRQHQGFDDMYDFITIQSQLINLNNDRYSFTHWKRSKPNWFDQIKSLNELTVTRPTAVLYILDAKPNDKCEMPSDWFEQLTEISTGYYAPPELKPKDVQIEPR